MLQPLGDVNYTNSYAGRLSSPVFLVEGGGRGLAVVDQNMADYAAEPGGAALRTQVVGNTFPPPAIPFLRQGGTVGGQQGPYIGLRYTRRFRAAGSFGGPAEYDRAESPTGGRGGPLPIRKLGDAVDLGPIKMYAYTGTWKTGGEWLRKERERIPFRTSPAKWYQGASILTQDTAAPAGSFLNLPRVVFDKQRAGSDFTMLTNFSEGELLGLQSQSRGDYTWATPQFGGGAAAKAGLEATHAAGGHAIYYVEGLIMWKRSRVGRSEGQEWALMEEDGTYTEHYKGFWHMCPAVRDYREWLARTLAEVVKQTGIDGFFIDSTLATYNHRCFNPAHHHPHPDVWNWGVREMLKRIREEVDKVNPETVIIVEGEGDLGREFADGFLSHGHQWSDLTFTEPLLRFLHPEMRAFESWGTGKEPPEKLFVFNAVNGHRLFSHSYMFDRMAPLSLNAKRYHVVFPELLTNRMSILDAACENCIAQLFEGR
ncbi:MAG: DUF6259 domain-containing protein, partial [Candidatus Solibacter sp.]